MQPACDSHTCPSGEAVILSCELRAVFVTINLGDADGHGFEPRPPRFGLGIDVIVVPRWI